MGSRGVIEMCEEIFAPARDDGKINGEIFSIEWSGGKSSPPRQINANDKAARFHCSLIDLFLWLFFSWFAAFCPPGTLCWMCQNPKIYENISRESLSWWHPKWRGRLGYRMCKWTDFQWMRRSEFIKEILVEDKSENKRNSKTKGEAKTFRKGHHMTPHVCELRAS